jgi:hypothetical protein
VANIFCIIEMRAGRPLPVSLEVLGQARRVATTLGATLYGVVSLATTPRPGEDEFLEELGRHGADKVLLLVDETLGEHAEVMRWGTHGVAVAQVAELLPPALILVGATRGGRDVAPRLAARMGAAFLHEAWIDLRGEQLLLWEGQRGLEGDLEFPVVATIPPGRYDIAHGDEEIEVEVVQITARNSDFDELGWEADPEGRPLVLGPDAQAATLAEALRGVTRQPAEGVPRLCVTLGPSCPAAEVRVGIGVTEGVHYALEGSPDGAATAVASAIKGDA